MIRYADLLLMIAECEIEVGSLDNARTLVNLVRARAANAAGFVMDGAVPAANYVISPVSCNRSTFRFKGQCTGCTSYGEKTGTRSGRPQVV